MEKLLCHSTKAPGGSSTVFQWQLLTPACFYHPLRCKHLCKNVRVHVGLNNKWLNSWLTIGIYQHTVDFPHQSMQSYGARKKKCCQKNIRPVVFRRERKRSNCVPSSIRCCVLAIVLHTLWLGWLYNMWFLSPPIKLITKCWSAPSISSTATLMQLYLSPIKDCRGLTQAFCRCGSLSFTLIKMDK